MSAVGDYRTFKGYEQEAGEKYQLESWAEQLAEKAEAAIIELEGDVAERDAMLREAWTQAHHMADAHTFDEWPDELRRRARETTDEASIP